MASHRDIVMQSNAARGHTQVAAVATVKENPDALTFSAMVLATKAKTTKARGQAYTYVTLVPVALGQLQERAVTLGDGTTTPLFSFLTADRTVVGLNVVLFKDEKSKTLKRAAPNPFVLAERQPFAMNVFRGVIPAPGELTTVYNAQVERSLYNGELSDLISGDLNKTLFIAENTQHTLAERLVYAFPDATNRVPVLFDYLADPALRAALGDDAYHTPLVRLFINRQRTGAAQDPWERHEVLPQPLPTQGADLVTTYCVAPDRFLTVSTDATKPDAANLKLMLLVREFADMAAPLTSPQKEVLFKELFLFADKLIPELGVRHPRTLAALLTHHPVPLELVVQPDLKAAANAGANTDPTGELRKGFEDGELTADVKLVGAHFGAYVRRYGMLVDYTRVVCDRFKGGFVTPYRPDDWDVCTKEQPVSGKSKDDGKEYSFTRPAPKNPYVPADLDPASLHPSGVIALDEYNGPLPPPDAFDFVALPLFDTSEMEEVKYRAADDPGIAMTLDEGTAFVLSKRNAKLAGLHEPWLQPPVDPALDKRRIPKFLFYAVRRTPPPALTPVPPTPALADAPFPNLHAFRLDKARQDAAAAATEPAARKREADGPADGEPAGKRVHTE